MERLGEGFLQHQELFSNTCCITKSVDDSGGSCLSLSELAGCLIVFTIHLGRFQESKVHIVHIPSRTSQKFFNKSHHRPVSKAAFGLEECKFFMSCDKGEDMLSTVNKLAVCGCCIPRFVSSLSFSTVLEPCQMVLFLFCESPIASQGLE